MAIYYITIFVVGILALLARQSVGYYEDAGSAHMVRTGKYKMYTNLTALVLILVSGLRFHVGADYGNYMMTYANRKITWLSFVKAFDEPGFAVLCKISSLIYDHYVTLFLGCSLITIGLYMYTIRKESHDYCFAVLMFIFCGTWAGSFGAIRQYLAAAILFAGHRFMYERKFWKWCLVVLIAICFHRTAIVMLPVYLIANKKISIKTILILVASVVVIRYGYDIIMSIMSGYKGVDQREYAYMNTGVNIFRVLVAIAPLFLYFITYARAKCYDAETEFYSVMLFVNAAFMLATSNSAYLARVGIFTETYTVFAFPKLLDQFSFRIQRQYKIALLACYFLFFAYQIFVSPSLNVFQWIFGNV